MVNGDLPTWFQDNDSWFTSKSDIKWQGCWECRCLEWHGELFFWGGAAAAADDDDDDDDDDGDDDDNSGDDGDGDDDDDDDENDDGNSYDVDDDDDDDDDHRHVDWGITDFQANQYQYNNYLSVFFSRKTICQKKMRFSLPRCEGRPTGPASEDGNRGFRPWKPCYALA